MAPGSTDIALAGRRHHSLTTLKGGPAVDVRLSLPSGDYSPGGPAYTVGSR